MTPTFTERLSWSSGYSSNSKFQSPSHFRKTTWTWQLNRFGLPWRWLQQPVPKLCCRLTKMFRFLLHCIVQRCGIKRLACDKFVVHNMCTLMTRGGGFEAQFSSSCHFSHRSNEIIQRLMRLQNKWKRRKASFRFTHSRLFQGPSLSFRDCANNGSSYRLISPTNNLTGRSLFVYLCKDVHLLRPENGWGDDSKICLVRSRDLCFWWRHCATIFLLGDCYRMLKKDHKSHLFWNNLKRQLDATR